MKVAPPVGYAPRNTLLTPRQPTTNTLLSPALSDDMLADLTSQIEQARMGAAMTGRADPYAGFELPQSGSSVLSAAAALQPIDPTLALRLGNMGGISEQAISDEATRINELAKARRGNFGGLYGDAMRFFSDDLVGGRIENFGDFLGAAGRLAAVGIGAGAAQGAFAGAGGVGGGVGAGGSTSIAGGLPAAGAAGGGAAAGGAAAGSGGGLFSGGLSGLFGSGGGLGGLGMGMPSPAGIGLSIGSSVLGALGSRRASRQMQRAYDQAAGEVGTGYSQADELLDPRATQEGRAMGRVNSLLGLDGEAPDYSLFRDSPGYQYQLDEGQRAIERSAAARGGLASGNTLLELQRHAQGQADQGFRNYLYDVLGLQNQGVDLTRAGLSIDRANTMADLQLGRGGARASGTIGATNALLGGLGSAAGFLGRNSMFNQPVKTAPDTTLQPFDLAGLRNRFQYMTG